MTQLKITIAVCQFTNFLSIQSIIMILIPFLCLWEQVQNWPRPWPTCSVSLGSVAAGWSWVPPAHWLFLGRWLVPPTRCCAPPVSKWDGPRTGAGVVPPPGLSAWHSSQHSGRLASCVNNNNWNHEWRSNDRLNNNNNCNYSNELKRN